MIIHESPVKAFKDGYHEISDRSRIARFANALVAVCAAIEFEAWKTFPEVDSPEVSWEISSERREELERILAEIEKEERQ